ncbi:MAG: hypothetical protein L3J59_16390, partial [Methylococcaceae bacterium]|nr:hypothetical protein [Methylococcaceae bacterium]
KTSPEKSRLDKETVLLWDSAGEAGKFVNINMLSLRVIPCEIPLRLQIGCKAQKRPVTENATSLMVYGAATKSRTRDLLITRRYF